MKFGEWQPIETAPRDTRVLLYAEEGEEGIVTGKENGYVGMDGEYREHWFMFDGYDLGDSDYLRMIVPTHWMPLPEPPKGEKDEIR